MKDGSMHISRFKDERAKQLICHICNRIHLKQIYALPCQHVFCGKLFDLDEDFCPKCNLVLHFNVFVGMKNFTIFLKSPFFFCTGLEI